MPWATGSTMRSSGVVQVVALMCLLAPNWISAATTSSKCAPFSPQNSSECPAGSGSACKVDVGRAVASSTATRGCGKCACDASKSGVKLTCSVGVVFVFNKKASPNRVQIHYVHKIKVKNAAIKFSTTLCRTDKPITKSPVDLNTLITKAPRDLNTYGKAINQVQVCFSKC